MKRLFVAAVLLALTAGLCAACWMTLDRGIDSLLEALDEAEAAYAAGGAAAAAAPAEALAARFDEETRWFFLFLPHEPLEAAEESVRALPSLLEGDEALLNAAFVRCRERLEALREGERLTVKNLF